MAKKKDSKLDALKNMNAEYSKLKKVIETQKKEVKKYVNEIEMQKNLLEVYEKNLKVATDPVDITYYEDEIKFTKDNIKRLGEKKAKINEPLWDAKNKINEMVDLVKQDPEMSQYFKSVASRKNEQMKKTLTDRNQEIVGKKANLTKMSDLVKKFPDMGDKLMDMVQAKEDLENTDLNGVKYNELKKLQKTLQEKIIKDTQKGKIDDNDRKDLNEITDKIKNAEKTYNDKLKDFMVDINKINHNAEEKISQKSIEQALGDLAEEKRTTASGKKIPALKVIENKNKKFDKETAKNEKQLDKLEKVKEAKEINYQEQYNNSLVLHSRAYRERYDNLSLGGKIAERWRTGGIRAFFPGGKEMVINELAEQSAQMEVESAKQQEAQARKGKFRAALKVSGDFGKNLTEQYQQEEVKEAEKTVDDNER